MLAVPDTLALSVATTIADDVMEAAPDGCAVPTAMITSSTVVVLLPLGFALLSTADAAELAMVAVAVRCDTPLSITYDDGVSTALEDTEAVPLSTACPLDVMVAAPDTEAA